MLATSATLVTVVLSRVLVVICTELVGRICVLGAMLTYSRSVGFEAADSEDEAVLLNSTVIVYVYFFWKAQIHYSESWIE